MAKEKRPGGATTSPGPGHPELIIVMAPGADVRATPSGVSAASDAVADALTAALAQAGARMLPLFGASEDRVRAASEGVAGSPDVPDLAAFYHVQAPEDRLESLAESLGQLDGVETAYVKPPAEPAATTLNDMAPDTSEAPAATPSFEARQGYLDAAPGGIDARYAWTVAGGRGAGVRIIDCEWGWRFTHEDLSQNSSGVLVGSSLGYDADPTAVTANNRAVNHGTAVVGEIGGDTNALGITGIAPDAAVGAASFASFSSASTITRAADKLGAGDIILLEIHRPGPRHNFQARNDQLGYVAVEWWPDDFAAIRYAVAKGIIVVEAAGNGAENLDDGLYDARPAAFPSSWRNPFNPVNPSSHAVLVGAGAPPPGTHGNNHGADRSRLGFSNHGRRVDCQGWGREVTTTGYGDLQGGSATDLWYTDGFSGTSSASPIVVGALACAQGIIRAQGGTPLTSSAAIAALRASGSPQQDQPGRPATQRIGNRPNLRQLIPQVADGWSNNRTVVRTHAKNSAQMAWVILNGTGWIRVAPRAPDGVTNNLAVLSEALANGRKVDVLLQMGSITQATVR
ncbi:S8 family serine peptidase [Blastococcus sp. BMG 814]|uniref:S8 family serine peptidase n=1 Tax=Blastococcus carthaginiensis TaxID=3050034 RepID=A0ABT9IIT4_9ACTN|nr:S8 family serine peptidase [Blastococcus carthaginiensis]MDP5185491.1 S8 family serine peptidase [Blastococcus carthaginiensis]